MATKDEIEELTRGIAEAELSLKNAEQVLSVLQVGLVGLRKKVEVALAAVTFCENTLSWMKKGTDLVNIQQFRGLQAAANKHREALQVAQEQLTIAENKRFTFEVGIPRIRANKAWLEHRLQRDYGQVVSFQLRNQQAP